MGVFGAFLAFGWIGGNIVKESIDRTKMDNDFNERHKEDRIYMRNGKYYDNVTGKRVTDSFIKDPIMGTTARVWSVVGDYKPGDWLYNETRDKWEKENKIWKEKIEAEQAEKNPVYLKEAEENKKRFAKYVLPYRPGIRRIYEGYIDRLEEPDNKGERKYYMPEGFGSCSYMREMEFNHNHMWVNSRCGEIPQRVSNSYVNATIDDEYITREEWEAMIREKAERARAKKILEEEKKCERIDLRRSIR